MVKLVIQIPCFNEEDALPITLAGLPKHIENVDCIEVVIIDDGSTDRTVEVARNCGIDEVTGFSTHKGLAKAFSIGLDSCLRRGADIIVNIDADNQYDAQEIPKLISPILAGKADMVIGDRQTCHLKHFSYIKRALQFLGSWLVCRLCGIPLTDVTSGFRAFNREAALRLNVTSQYTYTLETIIQASQIPLVITSIPITAKPVSRHSRLFKSIPAYMVKSLDTIIRTSAMYSPLSAFYNLGIIFSGMGGILFLRYLYFYLFAHSPGHIQSIVLGGVLIITGCQICLMGLLTDLIARNRMLVDNLLYRVRKAELENQSDIAYTTGGE